MRTLPCHSCGCWEDPNCTEDCVSFNLWAEDRFRKVHAALLEEDRSSVIDQQILESSENTYYEPRDEAGEPYKKGDLDKKMERYK